MTTKEINQSIVTMHVRLSRIENIEHWLNFMFLLVPLGLSGYVVIENGIQDFGSSILALVTIILFVLLLRHKLISPRLREYKASLTGDQFKQANQATAKLNEWLILSNRKEYFVAIREAGWQWDGIKITAILKNGKLYMNSMVNPSTHSNPFTFGLNKRNHTELMRQYQAVLKGSRVIENADAEIEKRNENFWNESEWSVPNLTKRIIGYTLSILFAALGFWIISAGEVEGLVYGIATIGICGCYIIYDINVILAKGAKRKAGL